MKKKLSKRLFVFPLWGLGGLLLATSCATVGTATKTTTTSVVSAPVYYTGNEEPAASGVFVHTDEN